MNEYLNQTLRMTGYLLAFVLMLLIHFGQSWAMLPLVAGTGLAVILLLVWSGFVQRVIRPSASIEEKNGAEKRMQRSFLLLALIKYPLVSVLIWFLTRRWDNASLMVFVGGILLLHAVITLRAVGKLLTEQ
jgi:hypothetical protein